MDVLQILGALAETPVAEAMAGSGLEGQSSAFLEALRAAVTGSQVTTAAETTPASTEGVAAAEVPALLAVSEGIAVPPEVATRLAQLDAILGLYLAGYVFGGQGAEGAPQVPSATGEVPVAEGESSPGSESDRSATPLPPLPREVRRVVQQLVAAGIELPLNLGMVAELAGDGMWQRSREAARTASTPGRVPALHTLDRAVEALLRQGTSPDASAASGGMDGTTERLRFGWFLGEVTARVEAALAGEPEQLEAARSWCDNMRAAYVEAPRGPTAGSARGSTAVPPSALSESAVAPQWPAARLPDAGGGSPLGAPFLVADASRGSPTAGVVVESRAMAQGPTAMPEPPPEAGVSSAALLATESVTPGLRAEAPLAPSSRRGLLVAPEGTQRWTPAATTEPEATASQTEATPESGGTSVTMPRPAANGRLAEAFMLRVSQAQANAVQPSAATQGGVSPPTVPRGVPPVIRVGSAQFVTQTVSPGAGAAVAVQPASSQSWLADQVALVAQAIDSKAARVRIVPAAADGSKARPVSNPVAAIDPALAARRLGTQADPSVYLPVGRDQPADSATMAQPSIVAVGQSGLGGGQSVFAPRGVPPGVDRSAVFDQIAEALSQARGSGRKQELVLRLKPEHLGDLRIAVSVTDGVVRATLSVQNMAARNVLESEMGQLRQTLADAGLSVDSLEVSVSGDGAQQFTPQRDREFYSDAYRRFQPAPDTDMGPLMPSSELIVASLASGATVSLLA